MAWKLLLTSDIGLFSLIGIIFMICMGVWFVRYFSRKMREDEQKARAMTSANAAHPRK